MESSKPKSQIINDHPIDTYLDNFQTTLLKLTQNHDGKLDSVGRNDLQTVTVHLALLLQSHQASNHLPSALGNKELRDDIQQLMASVYNHANFNYNRVKPLLGAVLSQKSDEELWDQVYKAVLERECTPDLLPFPSTVGQTPRTKSTGFIMNSAQLRADTDTLLKEELDALYVDVPNFHDAFFNDVTGHAAASEAIFKQCEQRAPPIYRDGSWVGWPEDANQYKVLEWLSRFCGALGDMAKSHGLTMAQRLLAIPDKYIKGSTPAKRKLDVGFVGILPAGLTPSFSQMHVLGELKSNAEADTAAQAWFDNARYVREVFASQDDRRFVLSFTLCGLRMRVWEFDRAGGISSVQFDINKEGARFVSTFLAFLTMSRADLGYDPTIQTAGSGERFIEICRNGKQERLVLLGPPMLRIRCLVGRATICWKAYNNEHPEITLVVKDSWQHPERQEEGDMLQMASASGATNVVRYYHHETVQVGGRDDDILHNIRKDVEASHPLKAWSMRPPETLLSSISRKRALSWDDPLLPQRKKPLLVDPPPMKRSSRVSLAQATNNRVHRRIVLCDYGIPIYKASSRTVLLTAFEGCIKGHKALLDAHLLHRDISINNLMINEKDPARSFLIDLDLAIDLRRVSTSGSKGITGTQAFMAIGALSGEPHTFMHDLESFFWVLFWLCIHYNSAGHGSVDFGFENWNYMAPGQLALVKQGTIHDSFFLRTIQDAFMPAYRPLAPWIDKLRRRVFPSVLVKEDMGLYNDMMAILREAREDPEVAAPWS